jgi:hypothetical protein
MKKVLVLILISLSGSLFLDACSTSAPEMMPTSTQPALTEIAPLPTSAASGDFINWRDIRVGMAQAELTSDFITEFGTIRNPSSGEKFFWAHVQLKNAGQKEIEVPPPEHFSVLYAATELKPTYGHRKDYADYMALESAIFPNQQVDAWLRFDVPVAAELKDLRFVFLPESSQVGVTFSSPTYPYAEGHPTFVWKCSP